MKFENQARLRWLSISEGGRHPPPLGTVYSTVAKFEAVSEKWPNEAWSVVLQFLAPPDSNGFVTVPIRMLVGAKAPVELLAPGSRFELYEGRKCVAYGEVLGTHESR